MMIVWQAEQEWVMSETVKYLLEESRLPKEWYNIVVDLPRPPAVSCPR